jgi:PAS domain S-box-containing protein
LAKVESSAPELDQYFWNSVDLLSVFSRDGLVSVRNPAWERVLGWDPVALADIDFLELVHPDDVERTNLEFDQEWSGPDAARFGFENRLRCRDGSFRWIEWNSRRDGGLVYSTGRDVTRRNAMLAELDAASQMNTAIFSAATDSIIVIDREMKIAESSPTGTSLFGYPDEGRIGFNALVIIHPNDRDQVRAAFLRIFDFDEVASARFRALHRDGHWLIVEARGRSLGVAHGPAELAVVICRDVTKAVSEEEALADSLRKITAIVDTAVDVITTVDRDFNILETSPSSELSTWSPSLSGSIPTTDRKLSRRCSASSP